VLGCFEGSEESWWHEPDDATGLKVVGSGVLRAGQAHSLPADAIHAVTDRCAIDDRFNYLIEPASLTIIGLHATGASSTRAHLEHVALRVASLQHLRQWHDDLSQRGFNPSAITTWSFGTFVDVVGPQQLTVRLFVPAVR
jgi:hypothetical protein